MSLLSRLNIVILFDLNLFDEQCLFNYRNKSLQEIFCCIADTALLTLKIFFNSTMFVASRE